MRRALMLPSPNSGVRQALSQLYQCHRIGSPAECPRTRGGNRGPGIPLVPVGASRRLRARPGTGGLGRGEPSD